MAYLVAEIGQCHQGSVQVAKDLTRICANPSRDDLYGPSVGGVDAVKLTKRHLDHELTRSAASRPYTGDNAFGSTYGEHRRALELSNEEHAEVCEYAHSLGLDFIETICAPEALELLDHCTPDSLKVASRDLTNHRLLAALAETGLPLIISTGMAGEAELERAIEVITKHHDNLTILHCLSQYPADPEHVNLRSIYTLKVRYPYRIGYSDHTQGVWAVTAAVALGAEVIEKHVTLDRCMRGSDHMGALDRGGIYRWVRDTRLVEKALGEFGVQRSDASEEARRKLARSVAARSDLRAGVQITEADLEPLSPGTGIPWPERETVVGGWTVQDVPAKELLSSTMVHY